MNTTEAAIQNSPETQKGKTKKAVLFSLGTLALGTLAFFGIKHLKNKKDNDNSDQTTDNLDNQVPVQTNSHPLPRTRVPVTNAGNAFPLNLRSKGDKVIQLQQSLMRTFGANIFPKYGADGIFGTELANFLRAKGYGVPLSEADFKKITQTQTSTQTPLVTFDPTSIAKGIANAIIAKDYNSSVTLLKAITNTTNYSLVSEKFKNYRLYGGVRQTIVTAMFKFFPEKSQKENTKAVFKKMGLRYTDATDKWSI